MQINRTLRQRITAENRARDIPRFVQKNRVPVKRNRRFEKRPQTISKNADCPPKKMSAAFYAIPPADVIEKINRKKRRQNRQIMHRAQLAENIFHYFKLNHFPAFRATQNRLILPKNR